MAKVLLVEDDGFTLATLAASLEKEGFSVTTATKVSKALEQFENELPDVLVTDLDLGVGPTGIDLAVLLRKLKADLGVVILTSFQDPRLHRQASKLPAGAHYVVKQSLITTKDLSTHINRALEAAKSMESLPQLPARLELTDVQLETMRMVAEGLTNAEIAKRRFVSDKAIEKTLKSIAESLGLDADPAVNLRVSVAKAYFKMTGGKV